MSSPLPLRLKLAIWSATVVALAWLPVVSFTIFYVYWQQRAALDLRLSQSASNFLEMFQISEMELSRMDKRTVMRILNPSSRPQKFVEVLGEDGQTFYHSENVIPGEMAPLPLGWSYMSIDGIPCRAYGIKEAGISVYMAMDIQDIRDTTTDLAVGYMVALPFLLLMVYVGGHFIAYKALSPVRQLADAAEQINVSQLDQRLPVPPAQDEIGRLARVLNGMFDRLDISFKQAIRFSADASHELKTPLTILRTSIDDRLDREDLTEERKAFLDSLNEQIAHLDSIIDHLLLLSRIDARQIKLDIKKHNITPILQDCVDDASIMAEPYGLTLQADLPEALQVPIDRHRFTQMMLNLLSNAIKYNVPDGKVRVSAEKQLNQCLVTVANTSAASLEQYQQQIFERFHRGEKSSEKPGHGLGLSLARELARAHGGDVILQRSDGQWTEFVIKLPLSASVKEGMQSVLTDS